MRRIDRLPNPFSKEALLKINGTLIIAMIARMLSGGAASPAEAEQIQKLQEALAGSPDSSAQLDPKFLSDLSRTLKDINFDPASNETPLPTPEGSAGPESINSQEIVRKVILENLAYYVYQPDLGDGRYGTPMLFNTNYEPVQLGELENNDNLVMIQLENGIFCGAPSLRDFVDLVVIELPEGMSLSQLLDGDEAHVARDPNVGLIRVNETDLQAALNQVVVNAEEDLSSPDKQDGLRPISYTHPGIEHPAPPDDGEGDDGTSLPGNGGTPASQKPVETETVEQDGGGENEPLEITYMSDYAAQHNEVYSEQPLSDNERASLANFLGLDPAEVWEGTKTEINGKDILIYRVPNGPALSYGIGPDGWPVELRTNVDFVTYVESEAPAEVEMVSPASITSSELMTTMPETMREYLETNFSFFAEEVEGGLAPQMVSAYGISLAITNGSAAEIGVPVPAETTEEFFLHVRADMAVRMAQQQGIPLTHEEALQKLQNGESFGFTGEVITVPSRALRTIASGGGSSQKVEFNPDLPELGGTQVTAVLMKEGFFHDAEPGPDRLESRRGLSSGNIKNLQYSITALPDGTILVPEYRAWSEQRFTEWSAYSLSNAFVRYSYLLVSETPISSSGERINLQWNSPELLPSYIFFNKWNGIDANTTENNFNIEAIILWVQFERQPEPQQ